MIGYSLRVGALLLKNATLGPRAVAGEPFVVSMRAWPWLCDAYRHLNNSAYLRLAEDARWAWTAKTPLLETSLRQGWMFLVGGADVVYRRPIPLMSKFDLISRVEGADDRWLYFSQEFVLPSGKSACRILLRAMVRKRGGAVPPSDVFAVTGHVPPAPSEELMRLTALSDEQLRKMESR